MQHRELLWSNGTLEHHLKVLQERGILIFGIRSTIINYLQREDDDYNSLGAATGTNMGATQCPTTTTPSNTACFASYLAFHLTSSASAYLEGLWVWLGDHDLDHDPTQITVFSGRGILSQSQGPVWMIGTGCTSLAPRN